MGVNIREVVSMKEVRTIKRYQNRKLYDTYQSCYVTLEEIAQIVREGNEIQVIDNKTKNDITYMTQIQLLFDQERKSLQPADTELLKRVIRSEGGTLTSYIKTLESKLGIVSTTPAVETTTETTTVNNYGYNTNTNTTSFNTELNNNTLN